MMIYGISHFEKSSQECTKNVDTVKPLYSGHLSNFSKLLTIGRCPLCRGLIAGKIVPLNREKVSIRWRCPLWKVLLYEVKCISKALKFNVHCEYVSK